MKEKSQKELEKDIVEITLKIHTAFPELSKYISEIPDKSFGKESNPIDSNTLKEYYNSLNKVVTEYAKTHMALKGTEEIIYDAYPHYPSSEDIYNQNKEERNLNPEDNSKNKTPNELPGTPNEKGFSDAMSGSDLDVPGSELDDQQERVGSEDEENNYYSIGGDNHNNLEEDNG